jgi:hypothetical protein
LCGEGIDLLSRVIIAEIARPQTEKWIIEIDHITTAVEPEKHTYSKNPPSTDS